MRVDRAHILRELRRAAGPLPAARAAELLDRARRSAALREARAAAVPRVTYPVDLPVSSRIPEVQALLAERGVVVVCGETGSGKTTQLPKALLEMGLGVEGIVGHTQPRRLAARSVAARIADELSVPLGRQVGSRVRFGDRTAPDTLIKLMTDGVLLAEIQRDRRLLRYDAIIVDEAHERSLNIDFLLGYLRQLRERRPDLRVVVTSATIDTQRFAEHFADARGPAPIVEVSGRAYPVEVRYRPGKLDRPEARDRARDAADAIAELWATEGHGDVLVFEPGEREIRETAAACERLPHAEVVPLYARLAHHQQDRIFSRSTGRRVVVATNVAETSLTVPGIRYVIDSGAARINRYVTRTKVQRLEVEPISRASAQQRAGRCGRVGPGICVRLYDRADLDARPEFTDPEIARCNLASVILQMKAMRLGDVEAFPFVEPPDPRRVRAGYELLTQLGALDAERELTIVGRQLARLPLDPRFGRMLIEAHARGVLDDALVVVAALSTQDVRDRPFDKRDAADEAHEEFADPTSDFLSILKLWEFLEGLWERHGASKLRKACEQRFLSYLRVREWRDTHRQLRLQLAAMDLHATPHLRDAPELHRALLAGLVDNVAARTEKGEYETSRGQVLALWPGSSLASERPRWIVAAEIVQTSRLFARTLAVIEPDDVELAAREVVSRSYAEARWDARRGRATAEMTVRLGGLELSRGRRVHYGPIDPRTSRELLIREALIGRAWRRPPRELERNADLFERLAALEVRQRATGAWALADRAFTFYDARLPPDAWTTDRLDAWYKRLPAAERAALRMRQDDLVDPDAAADERAFPDAAEVFGERLAITYIHDPASERDGVTTEVPIRLLSALRESAGEWLVPGMVAEKAASLVRALPKELRRRLDAHRFAARAAQLPFARGDLRDALSHLAATEFGVPVPRAQWEMHALPQHLRMRYRVLDAEGAVLGEGRDLAHLQHHLAEAARAAAASLAAAGYPRTGITRWDFELPEHVDMPGAAGRLYPAIVEDGRAVRLELRASRDEADALTAVGVRRLAALALARDARLDARRLPGFERAAAFFGPLGNADTLRDQVLVATAARACDLDCRRPGSGLEFDAAIEAAWHHAEADARAVVALALEVLEARHGLAVLLEGAHPAAWADTLRDVRAQVGALIPADFLTATPSARLDRLALYLRGARRRVERLRGGGAARDAERMASFRAAARVLERTLPSGLLEAEDVRELRWWLEDLRLGIFAEGLAGGSTTTPKRFIAEVERRANRATPTRHDRGRSGERTLPS